MTRRRLVQVPSSNGNVAPTNWHMAASTSWGMEEDVAAEWDNPTVVKPTLLPRSDGVNLCYPTLVNSLVGVSASGKSMVADFACAYELLAGNHVAYFDFESSLRVHLARLRALGVTEDAAKQRFHYYVPEASLLRSAESQKDFGAVLAQSSLAVIDAKGEFVVNEQGLLNDAEPIIEILKYVSKAAEGTSCGVLLLDHPPGDGSGKKEAYGSIFNRNALRGTIMHLDMPRVPRPGIIVTGRMLVSKDREGEVVLHGVEAEDRRTVLADVTIDGTGYPWSLAVRLDPPTVQIVTQADTTTTLVFDAIAEQHAAGTPFSNTEDIARYVQRRKSDVTNAVRWLKDNGRVRKEKGVYVPCPEDDDKPKQYSGEE